MFPDAETGESFEYRQLRYHPKYQKISEESYWNEIGRIFQVVGTGEKGPKKERVAGTETFHVIWYEYVLVDIRKEANCTRFVCKAHPQKEDPNRTKITIGGNRII